MLSSLILTQHLSCILVRTSTGIRPFEYFGNFYSRSVSDIECAVVNAESSVAVEIKYDDKLPEDEFVVIQVWHHFIEIDSLILHFLYCLSIFALF